MACFLASSWRHWMAVGSSSWVMMYSVIELLVTPFRRLSTVSTRPTTMNSYLNNYLCVSTESLVKPSTGSVFILSTTSIEKLFVFHRFLLITWLFLGLFKRFFKPAESDLIILISANRE